MTSSEDVMRVLAETSRTFHIPIAALPDSLREAVASGYLVMRAIDEVEDHPRLDRAAKSDVLQSISWLLQAQHSVASLDHAALAAAFAPYRDELAEVTLRIGEWAGYAPESIAFRVWDGTASVSTCQPLAAQRAIRSAMAAVPSQTRKAIDSGA